MRQPVSVSISNTWLDQYSCQQIKLYNYQGLTGLLHKLEVVGSVPAATDPLFILIFFVCYSENELNGAFKSLSNHCLFKKLSRLNRPISSRDFTSTGSKCPHCGKLPGSGSAGSDDPLNLSDLARQMQEKFRDLVSRF